MSKEVDILITAIPVTSEKQNISESYGEVVDLSQLNDEQKKGLNNILKLVKEWPGSEEELINLFEECNVSVSYDLLKFFRKNMIG